MSLAGTAKETLAVIERGAYAAPSGATVMVRAPIAAAIAAPVLHPPDALEHLVPPARGGASVRIEVTAETTAEAGRRLVQTEQAQRVVALNFASAKRPAAGFWAAPRRKRRTWRVAPPS